MGGDTEVQRGLRGALSALEQESQQRAAENSAVQDALRKETADRKAKEEAASRQLHATLQRLEAALQGVQEALWAKMCSLADRLLQSTDRMMQSTREWKETPPSLQV